MKNKILFLVSITLSLATYGQNVGIGTSSPAALLDIYSTSDGILIPRVALTGTGSASPLSSPTTSTLVYNTATAGSGATAVSPGFYYWNGSAWVRFIDNNSLTGSTTVSNTSSANTISTTVNGVTGSTMPLINTNAVSQNGSGQLISTINGVGSSPYTVAIAGDVTGNLGVSTVGKIQGTPVTISSLTNGNLLQYNSSGTNWVNVTPSSVLGAATTNSLSLSTNTLTSTVNGVASTSSAVSGVSNTSSANTLSTTVNGVTSSTVPIINSNALGLSGTTLTSTINGLTSNTLDISSIDKNIYNSNGTLTGARTVTMAGNTLNFTGGNVGIGIAGPAYSLDVAAGSSNTAAALRVYGQFGSSSDDVQIRFAGQKDGEMWAIGSDVTNGGSTQDFEIYSLPNSASRMTITAAGNIGVGTNTPAGKTSIITSSSDGNVSAWSTGQLTVGQDGTTAGALGLSYSTTNNAGYISSLSPSVAWRDLGLRANNTIFYYGGSAEGMRLSSSGYVGIGQSNPAGPLDVNGRASATSFKVSSSFTDLINNSPWYGIGLSNVTLSGQGSTAVQIGGYYGLTFVESGSTRMVINQGDVGIGTIAPDQALTIDGTAPIAEIRSGGYLQLRPTGNGWDMRLQAVSTQLNILSGGSLSSPIMSLLNGGNVGIGNSSPNGKLDIYTSSNTGDGAVFAPDGNADNNFTIQTYIDALGSGGWANRTTYAGGCCNNLALQPDVGTVSIGGTSASNKFNVYGNSYFSGYIGINTTGPAVPLDIQNSTAYNEGTYEALYYNSGSSYGITPASCSSCGVSIHATGRILAAEIDATSDRRIKTNIEPLSSRPLLDIANSLAVVHYNYIDWMTKGRTTKTGFIAQEVEKNIPSAVTTSTDFIPSIFETSELVKVDGKRLLVTTHKPHALAAGDEVRIFDKANKRYDVKVAEIISAVEFSVNDWTGDADPLFIYGKKVTDLHSVDFDQITAVAIGAVQELSKRVHSLERKNQSLEDQNRSIQSQVNVLKAVVEELKQNVESRALK